VRRLVHYTWIAVAAAALYAAWIFASRRLSNPEKPTAEPGLAAEYVPDTKLKVLQFYASPSEFVEGGKALLCYGVENAKAVRMEPAVDGIWPSRNRCVEVAPAKTTRYKLIAEGANGQAETAITEVKVSADPTQLPKVVFFTAGPAKQTAAEKAAGGSGVWSICYQVQNAAEVTIEPPIIPPTSAPNGCMYDKPGKTTTYTLTARDAKGRTATQRVTVKIQP
jgi:hypothetical protein